MCKTGRVCSLWCMMEYLFEPLYKQEGWQPSSVPVLPFAIGVVLAMWAFNTYVRLMLPQPGSCLLTT